MDTDTPETDTFLISGKAHYMAGEFARKLERERDEWKAKFIQQNKDLGCEQMDPNGTIWDYAKKVQSEILTVTKELDEAQKDIIFWQSLAEGRRRTEDADSELWGEAGLIAATMRCVDALGEVTDQRDKLAEALKQCREDSVELLGERDWWKNEPRLNYDKHYQKTRDNVTRADAALQSLTPNAKSPDAGEKGKADE